MIRLDFQQKQEACLLSKSSRPAKLCTVITLPLLDFYHIPILQLSDAITLSFSLPTISV